MKDTILKILIVMALMTGTAAATEIIASNTLQYANDAEVSTFETSYNWKNPTKEILMTESYTGSWRISFDVKSVTGSPVKAKFCDYHGLCTTERVTSSTTWKTYTEDINSISTYYQEWPRLVASSTYGEGVVVRNLRIGFSPAPTRPTTNLPPILSNIWGAIQIWLKSIGL